MGNQSQFTDLANEVRSILPTKEAAFHLNRAVQTLRMWKHFDSGPIKPVTINGRLGWKTSDIKKVMGIE